MLETRAYRRFRLPRCATPTNLVAVGIMIVANACGGGDDMADSGSDATADGPTEDATKDSSTEAGKDAGVDAHDASNDVNDGSTQDVSDDGPTDAATEASVDGGTDATFLDATVTCGSMSSYGFVGSGDSGICGQGEDYTCGTDMYQIECDCPTATCSCEKNGSPVGSMPSYAGCPSCSLTPSFSSLAIACGIPY
jgi:hypothetical protein